MASKHETFVPTFTNESGKNTGVLTSLNHPEYELVNPAGLTFRITRSETNPPFEVEHIMNRPFAEREAGDLDPSPLEQINGYGKTLKQAVTMWACLMTDYYEDLSVVDPKEHEAMSPQLWQMRWSLGTQIKPKNQSTPGLLGLFKKSN